MKYYLKLLIATIFHSRKYEIKRAYFHRDHPAAFDDTINNDQWQKEVYEFARKIFDENKLQTVLDIGCGSAYKFIQNFKDKNITGIEIEPTLSWLKKEYPQHKWAEINELKNDEQFGLIICSDVIEHIPDPDVLLDKINSLDFKFLVLSTPDRELIKNKYNSIGPPFNPCHCREWNFDEFGKYIGARYKIISHFISNEEQKTQVILCIKN